MQENFPRIKRTLNLHIERTHRRPHIKDQDQSTLRQSPRDIIQISKLENENQGFQEKDHKFTPAD